MRRLPSRMQVTGDVIRLWPVLVLAALAVLLPHWIPQPSQPRDAVRAQGQTTVAVVPSATNLSVGQTTAVAVVVRDVADMAGAGVVITFDPNVVHVTDAAGNDVASVALGNGQCYSHGSGSFIAENVVDNTTGVLSYAEAALSDPVVTGSCTVTTFHLTGRAGGASSLQFRMSDLGDHDAHPIPAAVQNSAVTVQGPAALTTPTAVASPTPQVLPPGGPLATPTAPPPLSTPGMPAPTVTATPSRPAVIPPTPAPGLAGPTAVTILPPVAGVENPPAVPGTGTLAGQVSLQGAAANDLTFIRICLDRAETSLYPGMCERGTRAFTADDGAFRISGLQPGAYTVTASMPGYLPARHVNAAVAPDATTTLNPVMLLPGNVQLGTPGQVDAPLFAEVGENWLLLTPRPW